MAIHSQSVLITGASSGIGAALAKEYSRNGFNLLLVARREDRLQSLALEIQQLFPKCKVEIFVGDVTQATDMEGAVQLATEKFGGLDVVIANAGFAVSGSLLQLKVEDYRRQFETNVFGVLNTVYAAIEELKKTKGRLVFIGSVASHLSLPMSSAYSMSKFAIKALSNALSLELEAVGVSSTLICPGFISTEIFQVDNKGKNKPEIRMEPPSAILMDSKKAARQIYSAVRSRKTEKVITGHGKVAVFAQRHLPGVISFAARRGYKAQIGKLGERFANKGL